MTRAHALVVAGLVLAAPAIGRELPAPLVQAPLVQTPLVQTGPLSFAPLVRRVVPAVVNIAVSERVDASDSESVPPEVRGTPFERQFRDRLRKRHDQVLGAGSGFVLDPSGIIVTNNHVVGNADRIVVSMGDGRELPATVIGADELTDIAVIEVHSGTVLPYVSWGDSDAVQVGDWILAAGNPFGLGSSVTAGIVSARGRDIGAGPFDDFIQVDAPINPGNSGGPTFNLSGQVIALNTAIVSPTGGSVGIGFAIPSNIAAGVVSELRRSGHIDRGWLGVTVQDLPGLHPNGVSIATVERTGPAARGGLRAGDVVLSINGDKVDSARGLIRAVAAARPGRVLQIEVRRQNQAMELQVAVGRRPVEPG